MSAANIVFGGKMYKNKAFTLIELIMAVTLIIILSTIGYAVYRSNVNKAIAMEAKALLHDVHAAEQIYRARNGEFRNLSSTTYDVTLGVDFRGNRYFSQFTVLVNGSNNNNFTITTNQYKGKALTLAGSLTGSPVITDPFSNS